MTQVKEVDFKKINALISRVEHALEHGLSLDAEDMRLILSAIHTLLEVQTKLEEKDMTLHKLKKLLGMIKKSERRSSSGGKKNTGNNKKGTTKPKKPPIRTTMHSLVDLKKGEPCTECPKGKYRKKEPIEFIRVTGSTEYESEKHLIERLECDLCGHVVTAEVPESVTNDGEVGQKYGYSARSMMAIKKHFSGNPLRISGNLNTHYGHDEHLYFVKQLRSLF